MIESSQCRSDAPDRNNGKRANTRLGLRHMQYYTITAVDSVRHRPSLLAKLQWEDFEDGENLPKVAIEPSQSASVF